jgi:tripartite-type tricarboxylate transporter receptor subunit TctC
MMLWRRACSGVLSAALLAAGATAISAQGYPNAAVKVISDSSPGSAPDVILRVVGEALTPIWNQQVVVLNQPGASGSRAARAAATSPPDGYTLFMAVSSAFVTVKGTAPGIPIELPGDLSPIGLIAENPMFMVASPQLGAKTLAALIEEAKKRPGDISYAASGRGRLSHLTGELLQRRSDIKLLMVPYSSGGPAQAISDLAGGRVHLLFEGGSALIGAIESGFLQPIAVATDARLAEFPNLPTAAETLPGFRAMAWMAMMAPSGVPDDIVRKVNADLRTALSNPEVRSKLAKIGSYARPLSPEDTAKYIQQEQQTWGTILDELGKAP